MKKLLSIILTMALMLTVLPFGLFAIPTAAASNGNTGNCTWTLDGTVLTIKGKGKIGNYDGVTGPWGQNITKVIIEDGVTDIGSYAFIKCTSLSNIIIPDSVTSIGNYAFSGCSSITRIEISENITNIGTYAFKDCNGIKTVDFNAINCSNMSASPFLNCANITTVNIGTRVKNIPDYLFTNCKGIENLNISDNVTSIGNHSFSGCSSITEVIIPDGAASIGDYAFSNCVAIKNITLPATLTNIGAYTFNKCSGLKNIYYRGTKVEKTNIIIGKFNTDLLESAWYYNSCINSGTHANENDFQNPCVICSAKRKIDTLVVGNNKYQIISDMHYNIYDEFNALTYGLDLETNVTFANSKWRFNYKFNDTDGFATNIKYIYRNPYYNTSSEQQEDFRGIQVDSWLAYGKYYNSWCTTAVTYIPDQRRVYISPTLATYESSRVYNPAIKLSYTAEKNGKIVLYDTTGIFDGKTAYWGPFWANSSTNAWIDIKIYRNNEIIWPSQGESAIINANNLEIAFPDLGEISVIEGDEISIAFSGNGAPPTLRAGLLCNPAVAYLVDLCDSEHIFDNACDTSCNLCSFVREVSEHNYDNKCDSICNECGITRVPSEHIYGNACDTTCNECGFVRVAPQHIYDNDCDTNCNICNTIREVGNHIYNSDCDTTCNECGAERTVSEHVYDGDCDAICNECGFTREAQEHTYVDWIIETPAKPGVSGMQFKYCEWCGDYIEEEIPAVIMPNFKSTALTLQSDLSIQYKVSDELVKAGYTNIYAEFELNGVKTVITESVYDTKNGVYIFTFSNIAPHLMNDTITATIYAEYDSEIYTGNKTYSVVTYCKNQLRAFGGKTEYEKITRLLVDILNYGAAAQNYTEYNINNLANSFLSETQKAYGTQEDREYTSLKNFNYKTNDSATATIKAAALTLKDSVTVTFKFELSANETLEGITAKVEAINKEWNIENGEFEYDSKTKRYSVHFKELNPSHMGKAVYMTLYKNGKAISNTACYSIESYALGNAVASNAKLAALVDAMLKYGDAAKAYVG